MYWITILTEATIFAILALGLDMVWGWCGDFDLAFYGYFAAGVYMTLVLAVGHPTAPVKYIIGLHLPYLVAVPIAVVAVVCLAAVIGAVALRNLREIYFAVATLGAVSALYIVVENYTPLFNGFNGVYGMVSPMAGPLGLGTTSYHYFLLVFCVAVLLGAYLVVQRLSTSPFGRMLRAVREDEHAAAVYGRGVFWAKYRAYLIGASLAALAGGMFAAYIGAFNPSAWAPQEILVLYAAILVGGRGNPKGVVLGVFVVYIGFVELTRYLPSPASRPELGPAVRQILIGLLIILMLRFRPEGIIPERPGVDGPKRKGRRRRSTPTPVTANEEAEVLQ